MSVASVSLWGTRIGAVSQDDERDPAIFQYDTRFLRSGIEISPLVMPLRCLVRHCRGCLLVQRMLPHRRRHLLVHPLV